MEYLFKILSPAASSGAAMTGSAAGDNIWKRYSMGHIDLDDEAIGEVDEHQHPYRCWF